jgi:hypothetical protein
MASAQYIRGIFLNEVKLSGLRPNTKYQARVRARLHNCSTNWSEPISFQTFSDETAQLVLLGGCTGSQNIINHVNRDNDADAFSSQGLHFNKLKLSSHYLRQVDIYNPATKTWKSLLPMNEPRAGFSACFLAGNIVIVGGWNDSSKVLSSAQAFNLDDYKWNSLPDMLTPRRWHTCSEINSKLIVSGGFDGIQRLRSCEGFDPNLVQWFSLSPMHQARDSHACVFIRGKMCVLGGFNGSSRLNHCEYYDFHLDKWFTMPSMHYRREGHAACVINDEIVVSGGYDGQKFLSQCEKFSFSSMQWVAIASLNDCRSQHSMSVITKQNREQDSLFVCGGINHNSVQDGALNTVEVFNLKTCSWERSSGMKHKRANHAIVSIYDSKWPNWNILKQKQGAQKQLMSVHE